MSLASRQSITLLAIVNGVFITMDDYGLAPELTPTIDWGLEVCHQCVTEFPETGDPGKNLRWMQAKLDLVDKDLSGRADIYTMIMLTSIASHIITDLLEWIKDESKLALIDPVAEVVCGLSDQIDPKGDCFQAYEEADSILRKIYSHLEFGL